MREARSSTPYALFSRPGLLSTFGPLFAQYLTPRYFYFVIPLGAILMRSVFISFGHANGLAQIILLLILEVSVLASLVALRPHKTRGADVFSAFLAIIRLVCTGLLIAFLEQLGVSPIPRVAIGLVMAVIFSVTVLVVMFNMLLHSGIARLWTRRKSSASATSSMEDNGILEKGEKGPGSGSSMSSYTRPGNPTPERSVPLDPEINEPYPPITPTTGETGGFPRDSASTNLGHMLPRRWSITPPSSPADSPSTSHPISTIDHS